MQHIIWVLKWHTARVLYVIFEFCRQVRSDVVQPFSNAQKPRRRLEDEKPA